MSRADASQLVKDGSLNQLRLPQLKLIPESMDKLLQKRSKSTIKGHMSRLTGRTSSIPTTDLSHNDHRSSVGMSNLDLDLYKNISNISLRGENKLPESVRKQSYRLFNID
jgi:hypothetical protein